MAPSTFKKLQDKHVLVLGGTSGIGYAVAEGALADGARVTVASSTKERVDKAVKTLTEQYGPGAVVQGFICNIGAGDIEADLEKLFKAASDGPGGEINHVVYTAANASSFHMAPLSETTKESVSVSAQMRMFVPILLAKVAQRYLPKSTSSSLTFTSGQSSDLPPPGWSVMLFFTGGVQTMARGLAIDMAPVRVNAVLPGMIQTEVWNAMPEEQRNGFFADAAKKLPVGAMGQPEDVAEAYLWLMKDRFVTGTFASSNGGSLIV